MAYGQMVSWDVYPDILVYNILDTSYTYIYIYIYSTYMYAVNILIDVLTSQSFDIC